MGEPVKELVWLKGEVKTPPFSSAARVKAGILLRRLQEGDTIGEPESKPVKTVGPDCHELRIRDKEANWRIIYHVHSEVIVILDVFSKKTRKTPVNIIERCRKRLRLFYRIWNDS